MEIILANPPSFLGWTSRLTTWDLSGLTVDFWSCGAKDSLLSQGSIFGGQFHWCLLGSNPFTENLYLGCLVRYFSISRWLRGCANEVWTVNWEDEYFQHTQGCSLHWIQVSSLSHSLSFSNFHRYWQTTFRSLSSILMILSILDLCQLFCGKIVINHSFGANRQDFQKVVLPTTQHCLQRSGHNFVLWLHLSHPVIQRPKEQTRCWVDLSLVGLAQSIH